MQLISDYMKNDDLRHKLNELTQNVFGFDFESWVINGYFEGDYIPYSFIEDGKIISNVSANKMYFIQNGILKYYIQIGTVMTDKAYRHQGLAKKLMEYVIKEYEGKCDGIYLFGDIGTLEFYRKLGFEEGLQFEYELKKELICKSLKGTAFKLIDKQDKTLQMKYIASVKQSAINASLEQKNKYGLQMFYTSNFYNTYYADDINCFAVMKKQANTLILQSIICKDYISIKTILEHINIEYTSLKLGFSPSADDMDMFNAYPFDGGADYRFFYLGKELESKLFFPKMSHA